jgi:L-amino acid N-acyltransferase YncA
MPLTVRPARRADIAAITAIYAHWVIHGTASFELTAPDEAEMGRRLEAITRAGHPYLVAEGAGAVVGYAYANVYRTRPAYRSTIEDSIYVSPTAQRVGAGRALLARLIEDSAALGYRQMIAVIGDSAQTSSIMLHRTMGFLFVGTLHSVGHKFDRWLDTVLMQRALGPGDDAPPTVPLPA